MPAQSNGVVVAPRGVAAEILRHRGVGPHLLSITPIDRTSAFTIGFQRQRDGVVTSIAVDGDTKVSGEDTGYSGDGTTTAFSGQSLAYPPAPGSLVLGGASTSVKDLLKDGILYIDGPAKKIAASGTFAAMAGESMTVQIDGGLPQTITFGTEASIALAVALINTQLKDGLAVAQGAQNVDIYSDKSGAGSSVVISSVAAGITTKLGISAGTATTVVGRINYSTGALTMSYPSGYVPSTNASAVLEGTVAGPWNFDPADTLVVDTDAAGDETATFDAGPATHPGQGGSFAASSSESMVYATDGGEQLTATLGAGTESSLATYVNKLNTQLEGCHAVANANSLDAILGVLNEVKTDYEAHRVDATSHTNADAANAIAAADATDQTSAETLANELKADLNSHFAALSEGEEAITLVNDIAVQYEAHIAETTMLDEALTLVNELAANYELHRVKQPAVHSVANTTDAISATNPATDLAEAIALANDLKSVYNSHRTDVNEAAHPTDDDTNVVTVADAASIGDLPALLSDIFTQFNAHVASGTFHVGADNASIATSPAMGTAAVHWIENTTDVVSATNPATDLAEAILLANDIKAIYNNHRTDANEDSHGTDDDTNVVAAADATDLDTLTTLLVELGADYALHIANTGGAFHVNADATNVVTADAVQTVAIHEQDDGTNTVASPDASDLASLLTLVTELKASYNGHRTQANVHDANDTTNVVVNTFNAIDIVSDSKGTDAGVEIVSGDAAFFAKTGLRVGTASGTGDVADINAVTAAEVKTVVEADTTGLTVTINSDGTISLSAATSVNVNASSTLEGVLGLSTTLVAATASPNPITASYVGVPLRTAGQSYSIRVPALSDVDELIAYAQAASAPVRMKMALIEQ